MIKRKKLVKAISLFMVSNSVMAQYPPVIDLSAITQNELGFQINGGEGELSGESVSNIGDFNGDGVDDLIVGAYAANFNGSLSGASYIVFGQSTGFIDDIELPTLMGCDGFKLIGANAYDFSGSSVSGVGDVNGDNIDDVIIGAKGVDTNGNASGASYLVFGRKCEKANVIDLSDLNGEDGFVINGEEVLDRSGLGVSGAGDVNNDGFADILVAASGADPKGSFSGSSYVVFGKETFDSIIELSTLDGNDGFALNGITSNDRSGSAVSNAGDINGDGIDDLIIGADTAYSNSERSGGSYIVFGKSSTFNAVIELSDLDGNTGFTIYGDNNADRFGVSVSNAGDFNGDGVDDLVIGADSVDLNGESSGATYVVFGSKNGFEELFELSLLDGINGFVINGVNAFEYSGRTVSGGCDVNGDGLDDLLIGAEKANSNYDSSGASYVVFGSRNVGAAVLELSALNGINGITLEGNIVDERAGNSVSCAGDINSDGVEDIIIGAVGAKPNGEDSGASYVVFGTDVIFMNSLE